jgi:hypothetical protein
LMYVGINRLYKTEMFVKINVNKKKLNTLRNTTASFFAILLIK